MAELKRISSVDGFVHDIDHISGLSADKCNMLFLSDRSLYVLQNLAGYDVGFYSRYGVIFGGGRYTPVTEGGPDEPLLIDTISLIRQELSMDCLTDLIGAMNGLAGAVRAAGAGSSCCGTTGEIPNIAGEKDGTPPFGYLEPDPITDRRCKAANYIWLAVDGMLEKLEDSPVEEFALLGISAMTGLISSLILLSVTGPVYVSLIIVAAAATISIAVALIVTGVDVGVIRTKWQANAQDIVTALYQNFTPAEVKTDVIAVLEADGLSLVNQVVVRAVMPDYALNLLWFETDDSAADIDGQPLTYSCASECFEFYQTTEAEGGMGEVTDLGGGLFRMDGALAGDAKYRCGVKFNWVPEIPDCCGDEKSVAYDSGTQTGFDGAAGVRVREDDDPPGCPTTIEIYGDDEMWVGSLDARTVVLRSNDPFSTTFSWV